MAGRKRMRAGDGTDAAGPGAEGSPVRRELVRSRDTHLRDALRETGAHLLHRVTGGSNAGAPGIG